MTMQRDTDRDLVERLQHLALAEANEVEDTMLAAADRIAALMTERDYWQNYGEEAMRAVKPLTEQINVLTAENKRLRAALANIAERADKGGRRLETAMDACDDIYRDARAALREVADRD